ncbi:MAG: DUF1735 domain-containing protein [Flavisolibacter sp.]
MKSIISIKTIYLTALLLPVLFLQSCLKDKNQAADFSGQSTQPMVEIPEGGFGNFGNSALNLSSPGPDTVLFHVNLASTDFLNKDVTVKIGYDATALANYNASSAIQYEKFPDSIFSLPTTQVTIKAGSRAVEIPIIMYADKIDPTKNYMLPISITDAQGTSISGNFGTIYYHLIGNPLAGTYNWDFTRYNDPQGTILSSLSFTGHQTVLTPVTPTQVEVASGYFIQPRYELTFDNNAGVLSNFQVSLNADDVAVMTANGVTVTNGPNILIADPVNKVFEFQYTTTSRYIIDKYYK